MFERFSERARHVVVLAQDEAGRLDHGYIGTEHLLLGLLRQDTGVASRALGRLGIRLGDMRDEVVRIIGKGMEPASGHIPFTPRSKRVLQIALREAMKLHSHHIETEHLLLAISEEGEGVAAQMLESRGAHAERVRNTVIDELQASGIDAGSTEAEQARTSINVCVAGVTGWTGSVVARHLLVSDEFELVGAIARRSAGQHIGEALGVSHEGLLVRQTLQDVIADGTAIDVLVDYTDPASVKTRTLEALSHGIRAVIGTSGLTAADYTEIEAVASANRLGVIAAGNFSITAALAKHFSLLAARYLPSWEIVDYASAGKVDAPSGTVQELAESMGEVARSELAVSLDDMHGPREARGATIGGAQIHSVRLPGFVIAFETLFGLPDERLTIRHDAGSGAEPYAMGTLLAVRKVMHMTGLIRGLDQLLFGD